MRLFVIGHFSKGKSSVVAALRKEKPSSTFDERTKRYVDPNYQLTEQGTCICTCLNLHTIFVSIHLPSFRPHLLVYVYNAHYRC